MNEVIDGNCPILDLALEGVNTLQQDRHEALLIVASNMRVMRPEGKHLRALIDFMEEAA